MSIIINIILILVSLVLIVAVLMQEGNKQGLGAIGGAAETFLGKNKSKGYEGKLLNITKIGAAVFVVIAILATWLNARTYTVKYYVDGDEYFPYVESMIMYQSMLDSTADYSSLRDQEPEAKRASYAYGDNVVQYPTPDKEGYTGVWDKELPATMNRSNYELNAVYTINDYTLTIMDGTVPSETEATPAEAETAEADPAKVLFTKVYTFGDAIDASELPALPELEGYTVTWDAEVPATMPGSDLTITAVYALPEAPAEETAETPVTESVTEPEAVPETTAEPATTEPEATTAPDVAAQPEAGKAQ